MKTRRNALRAAVTSVALVGVAISPLKAKSNELPKGMVGNWKYGPETRGRHINPTEARGYITITDKSRWIELRNDTGPTVGPWSSFSGVFTLSGTTAKIVVDSSTDPSLAGTTQTRKIEMQGERPSLTGAGPMRPC